MKIYFEDGILRSNNDLPVTPDHIVDASDDVSQNMDMLYSLRMHEPSCTVYTNSILAFSNRYAWNEELQIPEIYIRKENRAFVNITHFTNRELKGGHNLAKMYISGEFDK